MEHWLEFLRVCIGRCGLRAANGMHVVCSRSRQGGSACWVESPMAFLGGGPGKGGFWGERGMGGGERLMEVGERESEED